MPLQETLRHSKAGLAQPLWGLLVHQVLFDPPKHLWWVWGLILNAILPLLPSCWGFSFALGCGVSFFGGIQYSPVDSCSAASCNFGVLAEEDECTSFYSTILVCRIRYDYTVEVTNRFKGLDLTECLKNYGGSFMTLITGCDQDQPQKKEMQKGKTVV